MEKTGWRLTAAALAACAVGAAYSAWTFKSELDRRLDPGLHACDEQGRTGVRNEKCDAWGSQNSLIAQRIGDLTTQGFACVHGQLFNRDSAGKWQRSGTCPKFTYE